MDRICNYCGEDWSKTDISLYEMPNDKHICEVCIEDGKLVQYQVDWILEYNSKKDYPELYKLINKVYRR